MTMKLFKTAVLCLVMGLLTACGSSSQDELSQWMAQQKVQTQPKIKPVSAPKPFKPENYNLFAELDPYNKQKLIMVLSNDANQAAANGALIAPELARRKEPLEEFPLDAMALVGSMVSSKQPVLWSRSARSCIRLSWATTWGKTTEKSSRLSKTKSPCAKSCKMPWVNG